jgi:hypothetical protein
MRRADREVGQKIAARAQEASLRAEEVKRRIERGDVRPRPLPGMREDSLESMESMQSMEPMESMPSIESADYVTGASEEAQQAAGTGELMMKGMPLEGHMPYDPASAEEDLAQRITEDTGSEGDPHAHNERKAEGMATEMTENTGAGGDMNLDAERRVDQSGNRMFED